MKCQVCRTEMNNDYHAYVENIYIHEKSGPMCAQCAIKLIKSHGYKEITKEEYDKDY